MPSADELERRRLKALEPGITHVEWGPNGEVLMPGEPQLRHPEAASKKTTLEISLARS
ncbi:hypothetical protein [Pelomonas sp. KK5]|uniref:hypothetical protein n=1 Tax=Pelomonas sp. KK5 TaxID=1855730 RepID=UPI001301D35B|nr:hypothetical protein [Pelomonas sp. KK5]